MMRSPFFRLLCLAIVSALAAAVGLGLAYQRYTALIPDQGIFKGIGKDTWISQGAVLTFPGLASRGNYVTLKFNTWRPPVPPTEIHASTCRGPAQVFAVSEGSEITLPLRGDCRDFETRFTIINPFKISATDPRELGAQLSQVHVYSRLGIPALAPQLIASVSLALFFLGLVIYFTFETASYRLLALLVPVVALLPLRRVDIRDFANVFWLWATFFCVASGLLMAKTLKIPRTAPAPGSRAAKNLSLFLVVGGITLLGAALRFYGLNFGLPNNFHPDEVPKANAIMQMVNTNSLNPHYFLHPSLLLYCTYFINKVFHLLWLEGDFRSSAFLAGRTVSALAGSASIALLYFIGCRLSSRRSGLLAAALLAVFPLHVTCSRYLKEDALLLFFILACLLSVLKAVQENQKRFLYLGAILAGLSASTKYSGILTCLIVAAAPWLKSRTWQPDPEFFKHGALSALLVPVAFLCASPYIILDNAKFLSDFRYERMHMQRGHTQSIDAWSQFWMYHLSRSLIPGITEATTILALFGCGFLLWRRRTEDLLIVALILAFYLPAEWIKSKPAPQPERYIFPCLPFLALAASQFVDIISRSRLRRFAPALAILVLLTPTVRSLSLAREIRIDTRQQVVTWLEGNVPQGKKILLDWEPYAPGVPQDKYQVDYILRPNILSRLSPKSLKNSGFDYLILSSLFYDRYFSQPNPNRVIQNRFKTVFTRVPVVKEFRARSGTYGFHNPTLTVFSLRQEDFASLDLQLRQKSEGKLEKTSNEERASLRWNSR